MRWTVLVLLALATCSRNAGGGGTTPGVTAGACITDADCQEGFWCLLQRCSARAVPEPPPGDGPSKILTASPASLSFGTLSPPQTRTLTLVLDNQGDAVVTLARVTFDPDTSPFRVEPMGYGPFWIRPGRSREIFVTFVPVDTTHVDATLTIESEAPPQSVVLLGN